MFTAAISSVIWSAQSQFRFLGSMILLVVGTCCSLAEQPKEFAERTKPWLDLANGRTDRFRLQMELNVRLGGKPQHLQIELVRNQSEFDLSIRHPEYSAQIRHRDEGTAFALPKHQVVFLGAGSVTTYDRLAPEGLSKRLLSPRSEVGTYGPMIINADPQVLIGLAKSLLKIDINDEQGTATVKDFAIELMENRLQVKSADLELRARFSSLDENEKLTKFDLWPDYQANQLDRNELETTLVRGIRRAFEILLPADILKRPSQRDRETQHGQLRWIDGQRVVILKGTPEQIGKAHGELLRDEANTCIDSVLYTFGTAQTIISGKWFRQELAQAFAQLEPHIPQCYRQENRALALALGRPVEIVDALNVFPEMFHCSGFAVFGSATIDGKLYHGRVLDYMTTIGLQDAATNFIVSVDEKVPFANVGYAGFTGSVSGMNRAQISLGEMGGRGEGKWNGVPMATLMRMALENCTSLAQVKQLWSDSPRTCEYYYVFADGKSKQAVGVACDPDSIEFVEPAQTHPRLGQGITDTVVLSAGDRLSTLRERIAQKHGTIDAEIAMWLMTRPVAMKSNLHNVLFVPEDGILYVANATHNQPAAERPYVRIDLRELLQ